MKLPNIIAWQLWKSFSFPLQQISYSLTRKNITNETTQRYCLATLEIIFVSLTTSLLLQQPD